MDRAELESLSRDDLMARAEALGVRRARIMTRPELVDEILVASFGREEKDRDRKKLERARGLFGRARDLLARVVDKGLHLPDAAERIRNVPLPPPPAARTPPTVLPTVTLAEIYAAQGHTGRAIETLGRVLDAEPEHAAARALLERLQSASYRPPPPPELGPEEEPPPLVDADDESPAAAEVEEEIAAIAPAPVAAPAAAPSPAVAAGASRGRAVRAVRTEDACAAVPNERGELVVVWSISERIVEHHRHRAPGGRLAIRVATVLATLDGPRARIHDEPVAIGSSDVVLPVLAEPAVRRVAVGWLDGVEFVPIAHAAEIVRDRATGQLARWTPRGFEQVSAA